MQTPSADTLLGDTPHRDYADKLRLFNACAAPEIKAAIASLGLSAGMQALDAGCGTGEALVWLAEAVGPGGGVVGFDMSLAHVEAARRIAPSGTLVLPGDLLSPPVARGAFDLVWASNSINHLRDPVAGVLALASALRPGGRIALCQSSFLADMYFAWDSRLERLTHDAVRAHYRDRYSLTEQQLTSVRSLVGVLRRAGLREVHSTTFVVERVWPLAIADEAYLERAIFKGTFGERLAPYLDSADYEQLRALTDPANEAYALRRPDFHFLQTFTLAVGSQP